MQIINRLSLFGILALCLIFGRSVGVRAQTTAGKDFWLGFMYNDSGIRRPITLTVYVSAPSHTTGNVSIPSSHWEQHFTVESGKGAAIDIPSGIGMARKSEQVEPRAIHVEADDTVACFALNYSPQTADASVILPTKALGKEYLILAYTVSNYPSECMIVASLDSTQIEITPNAATLGGKKPEIPFTITLSRGEEYQVQSNGDLTGTRIIASKPVAVFGGSACASIPPGADFSDHLYEQMYPLTSWGKHFITTPLKSRKGDTFRFLASQDSTKLSVGTKTMELQADRFYECILREPTVISATRPIAVAQYSNSSGFDNVENADPFMIVLSPNEQMQNRVTFNAFASSVITAYYLNLVVQQRGSELLRLDGKPVAFSEIPGTTNFKYAALKIAAGDHTIASDSGFIAYVYGYGHAESYGYSAGASIRAIQHFALIRGKALDKKTSKPIAAKIVYETLPEGRTVGVVNSNPSTGEYTAVLSTGFNYSIHAEASGYYAISDNFAALDTTQDMRLARDLELAPIEIGQVIRLNNVFFDLNLAVLRPESFPELDRVIKLMRENKEINIAVSGHTDNIGSDEKNLQLSIDRATAVATYIKQGGIDVERVTASGFGKTKPVATNDTEEGRQQNRRVEFSIVK